MYFLKKMRFISAISIATILSGVGMTACKTITADSSTSSTASSSVRFAGGAKGVKIITSDSNGGSFGVPSTTPSPTPIPTTYPGADGTSTYLPGLSPSAYYDLDGITGITKPSWLLDFQMGISSAAASSACATFGGGGALDPLGFYRVSESNCTVAHDGLGGGTDRVNFRIILNRDTAYIGSAENLLIQVEYQASGLHLNSDGSATDAEDNLDQLWKIYWNSTLAATIASPPKSFGVFIPPNYSACLASGTGGATGSPAAPGLCPHGGAANNYRGSPIKVRQFMIPLSAYPDMKVIQFSRVKSRITNATPADAYVGDFCSSDEPLCLGVVIRSVTITRM